jgi:nicotinate-nucleotide pyrophosphorylase (carboxylating)
LGSRAIQRLGDISLVPRATSAYILTQHPPLVLSSETQKLIDLALAEDGAARDLTSQATVREGTRARATVEQRASGVPFGFEVAEAVFRRLDADVQWRQLQPESEWRDAIPAEVVDVTGDARALLAGERTALNFLAHLSGVATLTARAVKQIEGTAARLLDTRKTTPGLRALEKQAVVAGGGHNHRMGLDDAILVKDNHIALAGGVREATRRALAGSDGSRPVEVECSTLDDVAQALEAGAQRLLLDNMSTDELRRAVAAVGGRAEVEASGGITRELLPAVASTGVEWISMGSLTHSAPALDLSMTIEPA